jgi:hypothetical protein
MAQLGLADNYIRRLSITSSLAAQAAEAEAQEGVVWPEKAGAEDVFDARPKIVYPNTFKGRLNQRFARSWFGKFFDLEHRRTVLTDEMRAGLVGFLTICYIVAVNPAILAGEGRSLVGEKARGDAPKKTNTSQQSRKKKHSLVPPPSPPRKLTPTNQQTPAALAALPTAQARPKARPRASSTATRAMRRA